VEYRYKRNDGEYLWFETIGTILCNEKGNPEQILFNTSDITERKKTEETLRKSEEMMRSIYRVAPTGIGVVLDRLLIEVNPRICEMTGYTREELLGINARILYPSQEEYEFVGKEKYDQIRKIGSGKVETFWQKKDGSIINVLLASTPIDLTDHSKGITFTALDITDRKHAEEALQESELILKDILESTLSGFWDWNLVDNTEYLSPTFKRMFGYEEHEMENSPEAWQRIIFPEDLPKVLEIFDRHVKSHGREPFYNEIRYRHRNGTTVWVICAGRIIEWGVDGSPNRMVGCHINITDRKNAMESLRESEEKYRTLFNKMMNAFALHEMIFDEKGEAIDYKFLKVNPAWEKIVGIKAEDVIGKSIKEIMPNIEDSWIQCYGRVAKTAISEEFEDYNAATNKYYHVYAYCPSNGKFATLFNDITDRKLAENEILKLNEDLEQRVIDRTAQLEATNKELEAFSYSVSHDLRAPLRHINGYIELLNEDFRSDLPEKAQYYLTNITNAAKQMGTLIDELLRFSRTGRQELQKINIEMNVIAKEALESVKQHIEKRTITWKVQELPQVNGDYFMLKQVWFNLIDNAAKYSSNTLKAEISIGFDETEKDFIFYVRDNGVGFDMKYVDKLFGVFQRLHSNEEFEGTGIGLANVQRIIHKHKGRVWAEAEPDKGASFYFSLPKVI
jgi:PAS domain S-box-containing protein